MDAQFKNRKLSNSGPITQTVMIKDYPLRLSQAGALELAECGRPSSVTARCR